MYDILLANLDVGRGVAAPARLPAAPTTLPICYIVARVVVIVNCVVARSDLRLLGDSHLRRRISDGRGLLQLAQGGWVLHVSSNTGHQEGADKAQKQLHRGRTSEKMKRKNNHWQKEGG